MRATEKQWQKRFALVYQAGIANVFEVERFDLNPTADRCELRVYQGDFRTAECICHGASMAGALIAAAHCNMAGDIARQPWSADIDDAPFRDAMHPPKDCGDWNAPFAR